ncbi:MAG: phosphoribosylformylglycinamidine synthase subunit PurL [candidate division KSB1 bacterium]|nr:phosphoribosylformylglycinamidine synthase subunit PurL [candidate division KSB1 bacterium]
MITRIEYTLQSSFHDSEAESVEKGAHDLGIDGIEAVRFFTVTYIKGNLSSEDKTRIAEQLLVDPVTQYYEIDQKIALSADTAWSIEVTFNRGVTDMVAETTLKGIADLGIETAESAKTARRYEISGSLSDSDKVLIVEKLLMNKVNEHVVQSDEDIFMPTQSDHFELKHTPLLDADDTELERISKEGDLFLNLNEMKTIQEYFKTRDREPTDIELETLAQTWSEHCSHKTLTGRVEFEGQIIDNPLKETIFKVTRELQKPWCLSVFKDNSGIIEFDEDYAVCFKVETHNHPSAIEPYGGANTGIGGVIRDPLGTGMGAKPIINTDVFCFGPLNMDHKDLPQGVLHPKRVMKGVVAGVRDYGNRMGIPTSNGSIYFDPRYLGNPLVFCGNAGLIPNTMTEKNVQSGDYIIVVGGRTGRDGIHGATASSGELHEESESTWSGAVQIGNPIVEKKVVDTLLQARDQNLYNAITDCGAGGLSSAIGELAETTGAEVNLERVPLKYHGLSYMEIWISEAQERMVIFVSPENLYDILTLFQSEDVEATIIGRTTNDKKLYLKYNETRVGELDMDFLHNGLPKIERKAEWSPPQIKESIFEPASDLGSVLKQLLAQPNICSKEWVIRQYDHEVQAGSVVKPLVGVENDGPADACITRPLLNSNKAVILSNGFNPKYGLINPYWMAASAIDETLRNLVCVGGNLSRTALLDNFCWGNTNKPDRLGGLIRAAEACYDMAKVFETPFISGKDSLNNEFQSGDQSISIPPTLLISAISVMDDARKAVTSDLKQSQNLIYMVGLTRSEMGGSHYYDLLGKSSSYVPIVNPQMAKMIFHAISVATEKNIIRACHDCSEGGLGVAIAEMAFAGGWGASIFLDRVPKNGFISRNDLMLFSESNSRFLVEVSPRDKTDFEAIMHELPFAQIGRVLEKPELCAYGLNGDQIFSIDINTLKEHWQKTIRW